MAAGRAGLQRVARADHESSEGLVHERRPEAHNEQQCGRAGHAWCHSSGFEVAVAPARPVHRQGLPIPGVRRLNRLARSHALLCANNSHDEREVAPFCASEESRPANKSHDERGVTPCCASEKSRPANKSRELREGYRNPSLLREGHLNLSLRTRGETIASHHSANEGPLLREGHIDSRHASEGRGDCIASQCQRRRNTTRCDSCDN